jgi:hypothetical protein
MNVIKGILREISEEYGINTLLESNLTYSSKWALVEKDQRYRILYISVDTTGKSEIRVMFGGTSVKVDDWYDTSDWYTTSGAVIESMGPNEGNWLSEFNEFYYAIKNMFE